VDCICVAQVRVQWRAVVNLVMNIRREGKFLDQLSDSQLLKKESAPCDKFLTLYLNSFLSLDVTDFDISFVVLFRSSLIFD
jgi:hypothetical protein